MAKDYPVKDLRSFIEVLEDAGELARVKVPVDLNQELGAISKRNIHNNGPALLFEKPGGSNIPIAMGLLATRRRYAMAIGVEPDQIAEEWNRRVANPIPPVTVEAGPCQQHVLEGDEVDLRRLPVPTWNAHDGGAFLTLPCHVTKDPVTGMGNVGIYRNQIHDRNTLGLQIQPYGHLKLQMQKRPDEPFPVAIVLGADPVVTMAACAPLPFGTDELAVAGALRGKPLEMVPCRTIPLEVPASAQIVIEGEFIPGLVHDEGPFGEFTGYYSEFRRARPAIRVKAITHQDHPILDMTYEGRQPSGSTVMIGVPREAELRRQISLPGIKKIHMTPATAGVLHAVVSVEKPFEGFGKFVGMAVLGCIAGRAVKQVIVVDDDVDPFDPLSVEWAVAMRVQPHRDVDVIKEVQGVVLDPSMPTTKSGERGVTSSKMIIDATRYDAKNYSTVCVPSAKALEKVDRDWDRYGISSAKGGQKDRS